MIRSALLSRYLSENYGKDLIGKLLKSGVDGNTGRNSDSECCSIVLLQVDQNFFSSEQHCHQDTLTVPQAG